MVGWHLYRSSRRHATTTHVARPPLTSVSGIVGMNNVSPMPYERFRSCTSPEGDEIEWFVDKTAVIVKRRAVHVVLPGERLYSNFHNVIQMMLYTATNGRNELFFASLWSLMIPNNMIMFSIC